MAGFGEIFQTSDQEHFMNAVGVPMGKPTGESFGRSMSDVVATPDSPSATSDAQGNTSSSGLDLESRQTMGAVMGAAQAVAGVFAQHRAYQAQKQALKLKQSEIKIRKIFAKGAFDRKMTSLFQAHKDLDEQSMQQHNQREAAYKQKMGSLKVMQAERGMEGTSAGETREALTRSNLLAEHYQLSNLRKTQRSLMYQREGIADERVAQELGFDMANANIQSQLSMPSWAQTLMDVPDLAISGFNTYYNFVRDTGRNDSVT